MSKVLAAGISILLGIAVGELTAEETAREYAVEVSATVTSTPPRVTLYWGENCPTPALRYTVRRKAPSDSTWGPEIPLSGTKTEYVDRSVRVGRAYEYEVTKVTPRYRAYGYIYSGIELPPAEHRGTLLLVVDETVAAALSSELTQLQQDLTGDGWLVERLDVSRSESVKSVKRSIRERYYADPQEVNCVFLFGHVPVPYSGNIAPDGHDPAHQGAWPCDGYYGDMDGVWTDQTVCETRASDPRNRNIPRDGKFDQSTFPARLKLMVGRVDLANMPGRMTVAGASTFPSEAELLRNYLKKDHEFRTGYVSVPPRGTLGDNFGSHDGEAFAASGWRNFAPLLGSGNVTTLREDECWISALSADPCLWSYVCGPGTYDSLDSPGAINLRHPVTSVGIVNADFRAIFVLLYGSWFGDWDVEDALLRSVLAVPTGGLACAWSGRPHWFLQHMGLGEPIGFSARLTQNNGLNGLYKSEINTGAGQVHIALMGDPTLRLSNVPPASDFTYDRPNEQAVVLSWRGLPDLDYYIYKATSLAGPFHRLTRSPLHGTTYVDRSRNLSSALYMVRAVRLETSASGSFYNLSQGVFLEANPLVHKSLARSLEPKQLGSSLLATGLPPWPNN
jgi:hypothetical protein